MNRIFFYLFLLLPVGVHAGDSASVLKTGAFPDTFDVAGPNLEHISRYTAYRIDSSRKEGIETIARRYDQGGFLPMPLNRTLNNGFNPYPLWLHVTIRNTDKDTRRYWWSHYSHADSILVYRRTGPDNFVCTDTLSYYTPLRNRKIPVRFLATELLLQPGEYVELFIKVRNMRSTQHAIADLTTPDHNLLWEKGFYWSIGIFIGCFLLVMVFSLIIGIFTRERIFFWYGLFILLTTCVTLIEELLVTAFPGNGIFPVLTRLQPLALVIIAQGLHYRVVRYIVRPSRREQFFRYLDRFNLAGTLFGVLALLGYAAGLEQIEVGQLVFDAFLYTGIIVVCLMMISMFTVICLSASKGWQWLAFPIAGFLSLYFNPAGFWLNYSGLLHYYEITYPNYFYWTICGEFVILSCLLAWRYRETVKKNYRLLQERAIQDKQMYHRELAVQEQERRQIARDLHDDLGASISAIKLVISNSYAHDKHLMAMIGKASNNLRYFFTLLSLDGMGEQGIFNALRKKVEELNRLGVVSFSFIPVGSDALIDRRIAQALWRISSELLNNILRHAGASEANLQLIVDDEQVVLMTEDNGKGYSPGQQHTGMGLGNIQARASELRGEVHISSGPDGTTTIVTIPLNITL
ncbi:sensor histidine kinase [Pseudoflavitalea rhizosphaerae]|uniref:sensor histidine kinase n=1 Tax=Pseudoflavitalea rhizosphaerae TaxID=1884793 RepID=UPI000F8CDC91|nr:7TM-DISM domain-containing protein [Pseudoflavitalea rhizosphaerae]